MLKLRNVTATVLALCLFAGALAGFAAEAPNVGTVNLNEATVEQLAYLPRVGPALSLRIIEFRKENGPFKAVEDLMLVRGIGEKTFALMRPYLRIEGKTTLAEKIRGVRPVASSADEEQR